MSLEFDLSLARRELLVGESAPISLSVANPTGADMVVPDPRRSHDWPRIRVRDLDRGTEQTYGPHDLEDRRNHEFLPPPRPVPLTLEPKQALAWQDELLRWIELPHAGKYELTGIMLGPAGEVVTKPIALTVLPVKLVSAVFAGADSGYNPFRYCIWSHDAGGGCVLVLSGVNTSRDGPVLVQSRRVAELDRVVAPVLSVTPHKKPFPAHWLAWLQGERLAGMYVYQQRTLVPRAERPLDAPTERLLAPLLLEPPGHAAQPARAYAFSWQPGLGSAHLAVHTFEPEGTITPGPRIPIDVGVLQWAGALSLSSGEGRLVLAVLRGDDVDIDMLLRFRGGSVPAQPLHAASFHGSLLGAAIALDASEAIAGVAVVLAPSSGGASIERFRVERDGGASTSPSIALHGCPTDLDHAVADTTPEGACVVLVRSTAGAWFFAGPDGACRPLPAALAPFGEPIGAFFRNRTEPLAVMASPDRGITWHRLRA